MEVNHILLAIKPHHRIAGSLGGALSNLLSYELADMDDMPHPITCISYAAPLVGNKSFHKANAGLERIGRLRHIRLSNEKDVIPFSPPFSGYTQTGINLHLLDDDGKYSLAYSNKIKKSFFSQMRPSSGKAHSLVEYWERGQQAEMQYLNTLKEGKFDALYISDLYERLLPAE